MNKSLKTLGIIALCITGVMVLGAATMHPLGDYGVWAISGPWYYSSALKEYVTYANVNPKYVPTPDTLLPAAAETTGWFRIESNRIYISGLWDGDTSAGKDSAAGTVHLDCSMDTAFSYVIKHDSFTFADSTDDANGTVLFDSLDGISGSWGRFRYNNRSADTTGNIELYGLGPYGYFID